MTKKIKINKTGDQKNRRHRIQRHEEEKTTAAADPPLCSVARVKAETSGREEGEGEYSCQEFTDTEV